MQRLSEALLPSARLPASPEQPKFSAATLRFLWGSRCVTLPAKSTHLIFAKTNKPPAPHLLHLSLPHCNLQLFVAHLFPSTHLIDLFREFLENSRVSSSQTGRYALPFSLIRQNSQSRWGTHLRRATDRAHDHPHEDPRLAAAGSDGRTSPGLALLQTTEIRGDMGAFSAATGIDRLEGTETEIAIRIGIVTGIGMGAGTEATDTEIAGTATWTATGIAVATGTATENGTGHATPPPLPTRATAQENKTPAGHRSDHPPPVPALVPQGDRLLHQVGARR